MTELSRYPQNSPDSYAFEALAAVQMDPELSTIFDDIRKINLTLATEPQNEEQINEIMYHVDERWSQLMNTSASFTGYGWYTDTVATYRAESDLEPIRSYYYEQDGVFRGAFPHEVATSDDEDKRYYEMRVLFVRESLGPEGELFHQNGTICVDDIISLEFPDTMSLSRARSLLEYYTPDLLDDIDAVIYQELPNPVECHVMEDLSELVLDVPEELRDEKSIRHLRLALNAYVNNLVTFDHEVPYCASFNGYGWVYQPNGSEGGQTKWDATSGLLPCQIEFTSLASIEMIDWNRAPRDGEFTLRPMLRLELLGDTKEDSAAQMLLSMKSIEDIRSIRHDFSIGEQA